MKKELIVNTYEGDTLLFKENLLGTLIDGILQFENDTDTFQINIEEEIFLKENLDSILKISAIEALITLKEMERTFEIKLNKHNFQNKGNKLIIEYLLESNEKPIKIEIEMSDINA